MVEHGGEKPRFARRVAQFGRVEARQRQEASKPVLVRRNVRDSLDGYGFGFLAAWNAAFGALSERRLFCG